MDVGDRIRIIRTLRGMTQRELAQKLGYKPLAISRWERGERSPDLEDLSKLAKILKVNLHWLLTGEGEMFIEQEGEEDQLLKELLSELERVRRDYGEDWYQDFIKDFLKSIRRVREATTSKKIKPAK